MLRRPDYAVWMLRDAPDGVVSRIFADLIGRFDLRPLERACDSCGAPGRTVFAPPAQSALVCCCDACAPAAAAGGVVEVPNFAAALAHVETTFARRRREGFRRLVRDLARLKGAPARMTETAAAAFFEGLVEQTRSLGRAGASHRYPAPTGNPLSRR